MSNEGLGVVALADLSVADLKAMLAAKEKQENSGRDAYKTLVAETVPKIVERLVIVSQLLAEEKCLIFNMARDLLNMKVEVFAAKIADDQQTHTFRSDSHAFTLGYRITDGWDDSVSAGIEKVKTALHALAQDESSGVLVDMVFGLLKQTKTGGLKASRVMDLQKMVDRVNDPGFADGVKIIADAYRPQRSVWFVEGEVKSGIGEWRGIPLSMSAVDFPADFVFDFDVPKKAA